MATVGDGRVEFCCKTLRGQNRKCPVSECRLAEVAEIRTGRFESCPFGNLEKTRSAGQVTYLMRGDVLHRRYMEIVRSALFCRIGDKPAAGLLPSPIRSKLLNNFGEILVM